VSVFSVNMDQDSDEAFDGGAAVLLLGPTGRTVAPKEHIFNSHGSRCLLVYSSYLLCFLLRDHTTLQSHKKTIIIIFIFYFLFFYCYYHHYYYYHHYCYHQDAL